MCVCVCVGGGGGGGTPRLQYTSFLGTQISLNKFSELSGKTVAASVNILRLSQSVCQAVCVCVCGGGSNQDLAK